MTLRKEAPRSKRRWMVLGIAVTACMLLVVSFASAGMVGVNSGFEDDDGNLLDDAGTGINAGIDWNNFADVSWVQSATPATPTRQADKTLSGWKFKGIEDWQATTADSGFAGGTKQDADCPGVITAKAPNKDDLKRIYLASKTVSVDVNPDENVTVLEDHTFLNLAWVRIPQNTTSPSAHIGFEFNKATKDTAPCGGTSPLVHRTVNDLLVVYDFEGGSTDVPTISLRKWVDSGTCEIANNSPPCWGPATNLTALGFAEAKVNTVGSVLDELSPPSSLATGSSVDATLGTNEFGEAGIDLTAAGVFDPDVCNSFGTAYAVSRSSGNSGTAQMKDLDGPAPFTLQNCGSVTIIKRTAPRDLNQNFSYTSNLVGTCTTDATPAAFTLNDNGAGDTTSNTETCTDVPAGNYTVTEGSDPTGFVFTDLSCTASGTGTSATPSSGNATRTANITLAGGGSVTCVYTNTQQLGAIKITKKSSKGANPTLSGAVFSITKGGTAISGSPFTTGSDGTICVDGLGFGDYVVTETTAPTGYEIDDPAGRTITVDNNASCSDATYVGEATTFFDTPVFDIQVRFRDGGSGATALVSAISCTNVGTGTSSTSDTANWDDTLTVTGLNAPKTIVCTIDVDP